MQKIESFKGLFCLLSKKKYLRLENVAVVWIQCQAYLCLNLQALSSHWQNPQASPEPSVLHLASPIKRRAYLLLSQPKAGHWEYSKLPLTKADCIEFGPAFFQALPMRPKFQVSFMTYIAIPGFPTSALVMPPEQCCFLKCLRALVWRSFSKQVFRLFTFFYSMNLFLFCLVRQTSLMKVSKIRRFLQKATLAELWGILRKIAYRHDLYPYCSKLPSNGFLNGQRNSFDPAGALPTIHSMG